MKTKDEVKKSLAGADVDLNVCDAPKAQFAHFGTPALTCPFGTSQTPHIGVCGGRPEGRRHENWRNKAGMSVKTEGWKTS
jgi:hypothetical protein